MIFDGHGLSLLEAERGIGCLGREESGADGEKEERSGHARSRSFLP